MWSYPLLHAKPLQTRILLCGCQNSQSDWSHDIHGTTTCLYGVHKMTTLSSVLFSCVRFPYSLSSDCMVLLNLYSLFQSRQTYVFLAVQVKKNMVNSKICVIRQQKEGCDLKTVDRPFDNLKERQLNEYSVFPAPIKICKD
jgi:hypothetical protein